MENLSRNSSSGSPFKHLRMETTDGTVVPRTLQTSASEKDATAGHSKKKSRRKFVRLIKAVLFETSLVNKIKKRAKKKKQCSNGDSPLSKNEKKAVTYPITATTSNKKFGKKNQGSRIISGTPSIETSSTYSSSSCASSIASSSKRFRDSDFTSTTDRKQKQEINGRGYYGFNTGLSLLLVALLVLVVWGKLFAILCTSAWLFFVPNRRKGKILMKSRLKSVSMDRDEYNKKIIMEGLLDRKRS